ncbi:hypothetical protein [Oleiharenicola sp. Vm1]|uniref:hypothetical protein n=1 Tax=Oleiharenicola sp. Vm1 TaxID=3398393 RepID=UPI0039F58440
MPEQRRDYLLQQTELLRQFVARLVRDRNPAGVDEALQLALSLQERLFPLPAAEFLVLDADEQVSRLLAQETPAAGREKCETYAALLREAAFLYALRGRDDLAAGARQLALHVVLLASATPPGETTRQLVLKLTNDLAGEPLHAPVAALLAEFEHDQA